MIRNPIYLIAVASLLICSCRSVSHKPVSEDNAIPVIARRVKTTVSAKELSLSGNIEGKRTVRLGFLVAGKIDFIAAEEGQLISKGQLLSSLDPTSYSIAKEIADAQVNQVQDEYDRLKVMHERNSISESDFAKVSFGLQLAKAQQKLHTKNLTDTRLYTPFDGVLLKRLAEVGEITGTGMPLFVVSDIRTVKVTAFLPENELHSIMIGQKAEITVSSISGTYNGKVTELGSVADPASRAFTIKVEVDNPKLQIRPGMIAEVKLASTQSKTLLVVPTETVMHDPANLSYVFVADSVQQKAFRRNVSLGEILDNQIEITSGLTENEIVVTGGQQKLADGDRISYTL
jgi:RND family efflux transporter MFP subunit